MAETTVPIPCPPGVPILGNVGDIDSNFPLGSLKNMADTYGSSLLASGDSPSQNHSLTKVPGEIYRLNLAGRSVVPVSSYALVNELCDEKRFKKDVRGVLNQVRQGVHDGLFTATGPEEQNWGIAHRVLTPAFGPLPITNMFDDMHDIICQLAMKWARHGPASPIMVTDDFTRLALDTLALCSMDYRFNSFYHDEMHPFIEAMGAFLVESGNSARRALPAIFYREADRQREANIAIMRKTADDVLKARRQNPSDRKDLLSAMLEGVDRKTGQKMTDESITDNLSKPWGPVVPTDSRYLLGTYLRKLTLFHSHIPDRGPRDHRRHPLLCHVQSTEASRSVPESPARSRRGHWHRSNYR